MTRTLPHNFLFENNYAIIAWMAIFTIAEWFSDKNGLFKPKCIMTFEDSLFLLRDVTLK